jgi:hypothetical protein
MTETSILRKESVSLPSIGTGGYGHTARPYRVDRLSSEAVAPDMGGMRPYHAPVPRVRRLKNSVKRYATQIFIISVSLFLLQTQNLLHWISNFVRFRFDSSHSIEVWYVSPSIPNFLFANACSSFCHYQSRLRSYYELHHLNEHARFQF